MQDTPRKAGQQIDRIIDNLNARWDLQIPRLHGLEANNAPHGTDLARKCSSRIRALCWNNNVNMDGVVEDFEERAARKRSKWIYKPSQEPGTLPSLPLSKSFLKRDAISKSHTAPAERADLLKLLADLLDEEYKLAKESESYSRTSFTSVESTSRTTSFSSYSSASRASYNTAQDDYEANLAQHAHGMARKSGKKQSQWAYNKRDAPPLQPAGSKRTRTEPEKGQYTIPEALQRGSGRFAAQSANSSRMNTEVSSSMLTSSRQAAMVTTSFESKTSGTADSVFSEDGQGEPSSNNTSMISNVDDEQSQYSGGEDLEDAVQDNPELKRRLDTAYGIRKTPHALLHELETDGPFKQSFKQWPHRLPYWMTFEIYRVCLHLYGSDSEVGGIFYEIQKVCQTDSPTFDTFGQAVKQICQSKGKSVPPKSDLKDWTTRDGLYCDQNSGKSVSLSAKLVFSRHTDRQIFDFSLNPVTNEKSCRFHRKWGADRFLVLDIPSFAPIHPKGIPPKLTQPKTGFEPQELHDRIFTWLVSTELHIAGRKWRAFYVEPKDVNRKKRKEEGSRLKVHLFAVGDLNLQVRNPGASCHCRPISLLAMLDWHLAMSHNLSSTDLKLFSRIRLGLSQTTPTVVLEPHEFIVVDDKKSRRSKDESEIEDEQIMTDGNALMSPELGAEISRRLGLGEKPPSVIQARISGAKGTWTVANTDKHPGASKRGWWLEVVPSQIKVQPHPRFREDADEYQRTFEVVATSGPCSPGYLNSQLITILENRGVSRLVLDELMREEMSQYYDSLANAVKDPVELRCFRQMYHPSSSAKAGIARSAGMLDNPEAELDNLLNGGFQPQECSYMINRCLKTLVKQKLSQYSAKNRIEVPYSTNAFCVPDPSDPPVLKPGEIQINFSQPVSNFPSWKMDNMSVLVARNPAHLASDVQKVTCVYYRELQHLENAAIFSVLGERPLAGDLSGGDYDGDKVTVFWDQRLVADFQNCDVPKLPSKRDCGITSQNMIVQEVFPGDAPTEQQLDQFLLKCCSFNGIGSRLGQLTKLLEKVVYVKSEHLDRGEVLKLATTAGMLVDAPKQGDLLTSEEWSKLLSKISKTFRLPTSLPYDEQDPVSQPKRIQRHDGSFECENILDHLRFDVAKAESERILIAFQDLVPEEKIDQDLTSLANREWNNYSSLPQGQEKEALKITLEALRGKIDGVHKKWVNRAGKYEQLSFRKGSGMTPDEKDFAQVLEDLREEFLAIEPENVNCYIRKNFEREEQTPFSAWALLKASFAYYYHPKSTMPWKIAGYELCWVKVQALAKSQRPQAVVEWIYEYLKVDVKKPRRIAETDEEDDEEFFDAEE